MRVCYICGAAAFVLGVVGVIFIWPFLSNWWSGSYSRYNAGYTGYDNDGGYNGYGGDYGGNGGYGGGYGGGTTYATSGQPAYGTSGYYRPRRPPPCYAPCY
jgi:hypothetical protein